MRNPFLVGEVTYLRPLEVADAAVFVPWMNDPAVTRNGPVRGPMSLLAEEEWVRARSGGEDVTLGVVRKEGDELIGAAGLHKFDHRNRHAAFGISLGAKQHWGKGHGTEATRLVVGYAFGTLNLNRVWLQVYEYNAAAVRVYEKVGFRPEGRLRQDNFRDGRYWDTLVMAVLRDEWPAGGAVR